MYSVLLTATKKKVFNFILVSSLLSLIAMSNCANDRGAPDDRPTDANHANTPPGPPASEYPGNNSDSTSNTSHPDSVHHE